MYTHGVVVYSIVSPAARESVAAGRRDTTRKGISGSALWIGSRCASDGAARELPRHTVQGTRTNDHESPGRRRTGTAWWQACERGRSRAGAMGDLATAWYRQRAQGAPPIQRTRGVREFPSVCARGLEIGAAWREICPSVLGT